MKKEIIIWKFQSKNWYFGFVIPDDRGFRWWDFFVDEKNFNKAEDWDKVESILLEKSKWKKPEVKILKVLIWKNKTVLNPVIKIIEGIYTGWKWSYWFIDIEGQKKWYFVYGKKKKWAQDGDKVKAEIIKFKWREEAIVLEILKQEEELLEWIYKDNDKFWFVISDNKSWDIFIAWSRKVDAKNGDRVEVKIIKRVWKNPEGLIKKVL